MPRGTHITVPHSQLRKLRLRKVPPPETVPSHFVPTTSPSLTPFSNRHTGSRVRTQDPHRYWKLQDKAGHREIPQVSSLPISHPFSQMATHALNPSIQKHRLKRECRHEFRTSLSYRMSSKQAMLRGWGGDLPDIVSSKCSNIHLFSGQHSVSFNSSSYGTVSW